MSDAPVPASPLEPFETTIQNPRCSHWMWIAKTEMQPDGVCKTVDVSKPKQCKLNFNHAPPCVFDKILKHKKVRAYKNKPKDLLMGKCASCKRYTSLIKKGAHKGHCDWCAERGSEYTPLSKKSQKEKEWRERKAAEKAGLAPVNPVVNPPEATVVAPSSTPPAAPVNQAPAAPVNSSQPTIITHFDNTGKPTKTGFTFEVGGGDDVE